MPSVRKPEPQPELEFTANIAPAAGKSTKRAKDKQYAASQAKDGKAREAIANNLKRTMRRRTQRKSRVKPLTRSSGRGRGNAQTRRRKESGN